MKGRESSRLSPSADVSEVMFVVSEKKVVPLADETDSAQSEGAFICGRLLERERVL